MGVALHTGMDVGLRVTQGLLLGDALVTGAFHGVRQHQITQANAVSEVAAELARVRRLLAGAQADAAAARQEAVVLGAALDAANGRAAKAEAGLQALATAVREG
ncbi:hypothetical protein ASF22_20780 [Methylobacterium sp. Leaf87]|uniref:hypothetical protein n=1 Tax=Methylobacterium sp. Leaf87 TaxID=1736243 RepID=UPI000701C028|nr:hypothetical protein [Methylobacterium sp. Leaf87]KQO65768.1 hypothetical protein ASF22_20780 [Methylobacterium sp. Leaf87]